MSKKNFVIILLTALAVLHIWCGYVLFRSPYLGIDVSPAPGGGWSIKKIGKNSGAERLDLKPGDIITGINGKEAGNILRLRGGGRSNKRKRSKGCAAGSLSK
ncbi:S1C family serine protease [Paenibacillus sp. P26]|nr:S1C family serine protease [Paenibacillus sp. P26]UUZ89506.1 S1C family serine protease [Paenibacillus sp. P25]